jgi:class 3 adenylate cyclase
LSFVIPPPVENARGRFQSSAPSIRANYSGALLMSAEVKKDLDLQIAHVLLIDIVGYSKLLVDEQIELLQELNQIVRGTECCRMAEASGKLIRMPTGDGMALLFFHSPEEPVRCALEISRALQDHPRIRLRMGVHSGPVNRVTDVNDETNIAGSGINVAQRVMDCGDAGHILLSRHVAEDLEEIQTVATGLARPWFVRGEAWLARRGCEPL